MPEDRELVNNYENVDIAGASSIYIRSLKGEVEEGPVNIILRWDSVLQGHILSGSSSFSLFDMNFTTRKIRISAPLEPGFSGSWVVENGQLLGMVIASYEMLRDQKPEIRELLLRHSFDLITNYPLRHPIRRMFCQIQSMEYENYNREFYECMFGEAMVLFADKLGTFLGRGSPLLQLHSED
ncbi:hypothetical protein GQ53DRAFT_870267 [Thozetella sp. PMI_491]|nr:hypothetical protein GQ53DRAFT_870267 [Thozetella sp. PMI_491]